jgi:uncharacterized protein YdeI (YjbR/CyaY-like superfamily)
MPSGASTPDDLPIIEFPDADAFEQWLERHADTTPGVWLKIAKRTAPTTSVTHAEALTVAICFGWIDGQRRPLDVTHFLQRFTPRRPRSNWSKVNTAKAQALIAQKRMRPRGQAEVDAAKADGRWERAYSPQRTATIPEDFQAALDANPEARAFFATLKGQNRYAFLYRIQDAKRPETRARRIATFTAMLNRRETFYP